MTNDIKTELAKYNLPDATIAAMREKYLKFKVKSIDDEDSYLACKSAHKEVRGIRIDIEEKRKELKALSLEVGRAVDNEARRLTAGVSVIEKHLHDQRRVVEDEQKRIKDEKERSEQLELERFRKAEEEEQERIRKEKEDELRAEQDRLEKIRLEQEEKERKIKEAQDKIEADKKAIAEDKSRIEREKIEAVQAKKKAEQDEKDRIAREKKHAEDIEKAKKDAAAKAIKDKEEADKKAQEEKIEKQKRASDIDKLLELARVIKAIEVPKVESDAAEEILMQVDVLLKQAYRLLKGAK